jgi:hypothetical protein
MFNSSFLKKDDYIFGEKFENQFHTISNIFYCKTDYIWNFLHNAKNIDNNFVLITHNSDLSITQEMSDFIINLPNLKLWFGQNIDCKNNKINSLPIGLENPKNWTKFSKKDLLEEYANKKHLPNRLLYANFSFLTNSNDRLKCFNKVKCFNFLTNKCMNNIIQDNYQNWLEDVLDHHYILCPRGNGIDTHRFWETLYLGRIPVTLKNNNTRFFEDLPALFIDDWEEITESFLTKKLEWFSNINNFNLDLLKNSYWKNNILSKK